jgi:hypothetical protein
MQAQRAKTLYHPGLRDPCRIGGNDGCQDSEESSARRSPRWRPTLRDGNRIEQEELERPTVKRQVVWRAKVSGAWRTIRNKTLDSVKLI